jgi:tripartite-type tricarboxylate transporter receptor subunit TctC
MPLLPDYPTVAESGFPGFQFGSWYGFMVPAKTPPEAVAKIHGAAMSALKNPAVQKRLNDLGYIIVAEGAEAFAAFLKSEIESFGRVLKDLRGTLD